MIIEIINFSPIDIKWVLEVFLTPVVTVIAIYFGAIQFKKQMASDNEKIIETYNQQFKIDLFKNIIEKVMLSSSLNIKCQTNIKMYINGLDILNSKFAKNNIDKLLTIKEHEEMKDRTNLFLKHLTCIAEKTDEFDRDLQTILLGKMFKNIKPLHKDSIISHTE